MADILQCSFCEMKFVSTYKLIPHIFLGHRKKILKRINKKEDVLFKCPTSCGVTIKANYTFAPGCKQDEAFISWLSGALVELEQHSNTHTNEAKATRCEYCQIELGDTIYWCHLQIHMSGKIDPPAAVAASTNTSDKASPPAAAGPAPTDSKQTTTEKTIEPVKKLPVQSPSGQKRPPSPIVASQNRPPSPPGPPPDFSPPASPPLQTAKAPEELAASTIPFSSFFKKKSASPPDSKVKSIYSAKDDSSSVGSTSASSVGSSLSSTTAISSTISSISSLSSSSLSPSRRHMEMASVSSPSLSRSSSLLENVSSTTSFRSTSTESSSISSLVASDSSSSVKTDTPEAKDTSKVKETETKKHKISLSDYAKFRKKQTSEEKESVKTVESKESETKFVEPEQAKQGPSTPPPPEPDAVKILEVEKQSVDSGKKERKLSFELERKLPTPVEAERKLSVDFAEELPKPRRISGDYPRFDPRRLSTDVSPRGDMKLITPKPVDAMRPPTPLDRPITPTQPSQPTTPLAQQPTTPTPPATTGQPTTPLGAPPSSEGSSRSTTPGLSRPTTPHDRSRRTSSDQRSRRPSDNSVPHKEKPKPVLTEEMERQIIFGGALLKGSKLKANTDQQKSEKESPKDVTKSTETTPVTTPIQKVSPKTTPTEKVSPDTATKADKSSRDSSVSPQEQVETFEERQKREREERERKRKAEMTREQKLAQVRKEIEMRFQEEELKRKKSKESQIKHEADLREKIRIEEEKLKKEKEKIASEKKRAKEEKRKAKKAKRKRKYSEDDLSDESESKRERKSEERLRRSQEQDVEILEQEIIEQQQKEYQQQQQKQLVVLPPPVPAAPVREKSPDQYEKLKLNFLAKQKEALEQELKLLEAQVAGGEQQQDTGDKQQSEEVESSENVETVEVMELDDEEDEEDDLEAMMRSYMEKEQQKGAEDDTAEGAADQVEAVSSLSLLMSNYEDIDDNNTTQEDEAMDEPIVVPDEDPEPQQAEEAASATIESDNIEVDTTEAITGEDERTVIQIPDDIPVPVLQEMDEETLLAAKSAAKDIMAPYKRSKRMKAASQLHCSLCKEEEGSSTSYISAYQLLSHVYLVHRKKILARSRKARGMTLSCPEGCGYITNMSKDGTSIDYFGDELPKHLDMLCEHIRDCHTGEPEMETCQYCSLPLQHSQNWSWQHLANHRNIQRFYCDGCNNFPFKNEVHKCPGSGLETYQATTSDNLDSDTTMRRKRNMSEDDILGKSQDDLEREAELANSNKSRQIKDLGNLVRFMCGVCDKVVTTLSAWLLHIRLDHLGRSHINYSHDVRCFCCPWMPPRFEKGREIIGVNNLVQHIITEHHSEDWKDDDFACESSKLVQLQREMERRLEREREELAIQIPKLPAPCKTCNMQLGQAKLWRYHALAHRFGEVYCSTCHTFILGHHFMEHSATCNAEDQNRVKVKVEKHRGDTFLDALDGQRYKVAFEYDRIEGVGSITIARTMIGTKVVVGNGSTHEEAARAVREQVENILTDLKAKDEESRKEEIEREDRQKLVDFFKTLIDKDKEEERKHYYLEDKNGHQIPVITKFYFTKTGKVRIQALVQVTREGQVISTLGFSRLNAVRNLSDKVKGMVDRGEIGDFSGASLENGNGETNSNFTDEYTCNDCRTTFKKDYIYNLHKTQPCVV